MANLFGQLRNFFRAPKLDEALRDLAPKQVAPQTRTSWVFDSHVMTEAAGSSRSGKNPQAVSLAWDEDRWNIDSSAKNSWTGLTHRERKETLLQIFLTNPWASNCIDTIALYIISGGLTIEPRVSNPDKSQRAKIEQLLLRINDDWDFNQYVYDQITDEMIFGETFTEYTMSSGVPYQLFSIDCLTMDTEHDRYGRALRYKQQLSSTSEVNYLKTDKIIRWWNPHKRAKVDPFSPLERVQDAILLDKKMVNWQTTFFQKGAKFPYSIEFQGDRDEADRFLTWFKQNFTGEKNAHLPPVTYNGAKLNPTGKGSIDIDFDRGLDRQQTIVLSAFHVPPSIACIAESGNRLTDMSDGQRKILQYIACDPRRHQFFEKFNYRLVRPYFGEDYYVSTRYADFRSDEDLAKVADMRIRNGSALIDEIRQEMGKEAYPDGTGNVAVIVTTKEITPVPRLKDLEDEQRQTAQQALDAGDLNNQMLATKVEQAKNPPPPPPMIPGQPPEQNPPAGGNNPPDDGNKTAKNGNKQQGATSDKTNQPKTTTKSASSAKQNVGNGKAAKESISQAGDTQASHNTGMMLAFLLDASTAEQLAIPGGEPAGDLHITLAYLGDMEDEITDDKLRAHTSPFKIRDAVAMIAAHAKPLSGIVGGVGRFFPAETEETPVIALVDVPGLSEFRTKLVQTVEAAGYFVADNHGYTPHITLAYIPQAAPMPVENVPLLPLNLDTVMLCVGDERIPFRLGGEPVQVKQESVHVTDTKQGLQHRISHLFLQVESRASNAVREGQDTIHAYDFTNAERESLTSILATGYQLAKADAYSRAMQVASKPGKTLADNSMQWAEERANSIITTYHQTVTSLIEKLRTESSEALDEGDTPQSKTKKGLLGGLINAAALAAGVAAGVKAFVEWKAPQVANDTIGSGANDGTDEAIDDLLEEATDPNNDTSNIRVRIVPGESSSDFCKDYAGNDYSLEEAADLPDFPAHPNCIHSKEIYSV